MVQLTDGTFAGLLDSAPIAMIVVDDDRQIVYLNAAAEVLFGYHRDQLIGRPVEELISIGEESFLPFSAGLEVPAGVQTGRISWPWPKDTCVSVSRARSYTQTLR